MGFSGILALAVLALPSFAALLEAKLPHGKASLVTEYDGAVPGEGFFAGVYVQLDPEWHTYWSNPGDSGAAPRFTLRLQEGAEAGPVLWPVPHRIPTGPLTTLGFEGNVLFAFEVRVPPGFPPGSRFKLALNGEVLVCREICIPGRIALSADYPVVKLEDARRSGDAALFAELRKALPREEPGLHYAVSREGPRAKVSIEVPPRLSGANLIEFFPYADAGLEAKKGRIRKEGPGRFSIRLGSSDVPPEPSAGAGLALFQVDGRNGGRVEAIELGKTGVRGTVAESEGQGPGGLPLFLLFAFLGGALLNLMPCVFPVLFMKVYGVLKLGAEREREARVENLSYSAGVVVTFLLFAALLVALRSAGAAVGWGFQLQSPVFVAGLALLFGILGLGFLDLLSFGFVNAGLGSTLAGKGGNTGAFFAGMLSVLVASPCTAPFMGASLGYAMTVPLPMLFAIFAALGLGLASPMLLLAVSPRLLRALPRPGAWMARLKYAMAIPMFGTAAWLLWLLARVAGTETAIQVGGALVAACIATFLFRKSGRVAFAVLLVAAAVALQRAHVSRPPQRVAAPVTKGGIEWIPFSPERVAALRQEGKWVFVDFTADWCITCKVNEKVALSSAEIRSFLKERGIVMVLADWTRRDPVITRALEERGRIGVPFYLLLPPAGQGGEIRLPEVLTEGILRGAIERAMEKGRGKK